MGRVTLLVLVGIIGAVLSYIAPLLGLVVLGVVALAGIALVKSGASLTGLSGRLAILVPAIVAALFGLQWARLHFGFAGDRTPAPPTSIGCPFDTTQRAAMLTYARSQKFAEYIDSADVYPADPLGKYERGPDKYRGHGGPYHGQWDKDLVDTLGDVLVLEPEVNIHRLRVRDLRCGRVQLRMRLRVGHPGRDPRSIYDSLKVPPGVSYLFVDGFELMNGDSGTARGVIVPVDPSLPVLIEKVRVYRGVTFNQALARWTPGKCWSCPTSYWCNDTPH